jgi:hypothetical protein
VQYVPLGNDRSSFPPNSRSDMMVAARKPGVWALRLWTRELEAVGSSVYKVAERAYYMPGSRRSECAT